MEKLHQSGYGAFSFDGRARCSAAFSAAERGIAKNVDAVKRLEMNTMVPSAPKPAERLHSGQGCWPDEPAKTPLIEFDELDDLPCPDDADPKSWMKLPRELRATILRARAAHRAKLERMAAKGQLLPLEHGERRAEPLIVEGPAGLSGAPKRLLQLPLFAVRARGCRRCCTNERLPGPEGIELRFSGERFDQEDLTVYMAVMNLYRSRKQRDMCGVSLSCYTLLRELGRTNSKSNRTALIERLRRLSEGLITIELDGARWTGSLLTLYDNEPKGRLWVQPSRAFQPFFLGSEWQRLEWSVRLALGHDQLALALWCYFRTFAHPFPVKVETLRERVGSETGDLSVFRGRVRTAIQHVAETVAQQTGAALDWEIDDADNLCVEWKRKSK